MATNMDSDSEVILKKTTEEKGVKSEGKSEDATILFVFRALTPASSPSTQGTEGRANAGKKTRGPSLRNSASGRRSTKGKETLKAVSTSLGVCHTGAVEQRRASVAVVRVTDGWGLYVLCRFAQTGEHGLYRYD